MKLRIVGVWLAVWCAVATVNATQNRPSFTGTWRFVAEGSMPSESPVLGFVFKAQHQANDRVLELPALDFVRTADGTSRAFDGELGAPLPYRTDGTDHDALPETVRGGRDFRRVATHIGSGSYRAAWQGDRLVIASSDAIPMASFANGQAHMGFAYRVLTTTFALTADGTLVVERVADRDPADNGQFTVPRRVLKSLYRLQTAK